MRFLSFATMPPPLLTCITPCCHDDMPAAAIYAMPWRPLLPYSHIYATPLIYAHILITLMRYADARHHFSF